MASIIEFTSLLQRSVKGVQLYGAVSHPRSREVIDQLVSHTAAMLKASPRLQIVVSQNRIFVDGQLVRQQNPALKWFIEQLTERRLNGFVMAHGITAPEIEEVVKILVLKPQALQDAGGAARLLAAIDASHVRLSYVRYEEVREGEIVVPEDALIGETGEGGSGGYGAGSGGGRGDGSQVGGGGMGEGGGFPDLPDGEVTEEQATEHLAAFAKRLVETTPMQTADASGGTIDPLARDVRYRTFSSNVSAWLRQQSVDLVRLRTRLNEMGVSRDELEELLQAIAWERLSTDERLTKAIDQNLIFELTTEKVTSFILELLTSGRTADASRVIEKLGSGLFAESQDTRRATADAFIRIASWGTNPGLPPETEALIDKLLLTHFVRELDAHVHERSVAAFENLYDSWIEREQIPKAYTMLRKLEGATAAAAAHSPWKTEVFSQLESRLMSPARMKVLLGKMYSRDVEIAAGIYHPLLVLFGEKAARGLLDALAEEEDRSRRGRLIKAIKAIGKPAMQSLHEATKSPTWYLVRNALNLIGDLVAVDLLDDAIEALGHRDDRVRKAAARTLGKLGGLKAEKQLGDALAANDAETQLEILSALGTMKGDSAIPQMAELLKKKGKGDDAVRLRACETLGLIGTPAAVPPLVELLRKKGLLGGGESSEARLAAAKALATIVRSGLQEARSAAEALAAAETDAAVKQALQKTAQART